MCGRDMCRRRARTCTLSSLSLHPDTSSPLLPLASLHQPGKRVAHSLTFLLVVFFATNCLLHRTCCCHQTPHMAQSTRPRLRNQAVCKSRLLLHRLLRKLCLQGNVHAEQAPRKEDRNKTSRALLTEAALRANLEQASMAHSHQPCCCLRTKQVAFNCRAPSLFTMPHLPCCIAKP